MYLDFGQLGLKARTKRVRISDRFGMFHKPQRLKAEPAEIGTVKSSDFSVIRISDIQILEFHCT